MQILFINNDGGGFAAHVDDGTTVAQLFAARLPHGQAADYLIRVNRLPAAADQPLRPNDRISMTPVKIEGRGPFRRLTPHPRPSRPRSFVLK